MPHSISLAESMNLEHSIKEESHERYPVHLKCLRKIKYPDFQAMTFTTITSSYVHHMCLSEALHHMLPMFTTITSPYVHHGCLS